jgi:uncharacterized protein YukE
MIDAGAATSEFFDRLQIASDRTEQFVRALRTHHEAVEMGVNDVAYSEDELRSLLNVATTAIITVHSQAVDRAVDGELPRDQPD